MKVITHPNPELNGKKNKIKKEKEKEIRKLKVTIDG